MKSDSTDPVVPKKQAIRLTGAEEMLLGTLFLKAKDAQNQRPILGDRYAQKLIDRCDIDYSKSYILSDERFVRAVVCRTKRLDEWCQDFLSAHHGKPVTVVHLACGLDCRYLRVKAGPNVRWIDVDQPLVVDLRSRLMPELLAGASPDASGKHRDYTLRTLQITKSGWMRDIPCDRPTMVIAEGLTAYLRPEEGHALFRRIAAYFGALGGEVAFDSMCRLGPVLTRWAPMLRSSGSRFTWGMDDPKGEIEALHPKLRLKDQALWKDYCGTAPPMFGSFVTWLMSWHPGYKYNTCLSRFEF